jgi:hypothetical protein
MRQRRRLFGNETKAIEDRSFFFGNDLGQNDDIELEANFKFPVLLYDVRTKLLNWVVRRWIDRCDLEEQRLGDGMRENRRRFDAGPLLIFTPSFDRQLEGTVAWCTRRGGPPLTRFERLVMKSAFRLEMRTDLPLPSDILEELGANVIGEIDSLAVTSFNAALDEMIRYHQFLLDAYATKDESGVPFSYSEVEATWFGKPHQEWIRQYHRIFERAADHLREETDFISILSRLPIRLLPQRVTNFSPAIISAILDLGPMLVSRLENWRTKHVTVVLGLD